MCKVLYEAFIIINIILLKLSFILFVGEYFNIQFSHAALLSLYVNRVVFLLSLSQGHPRTETPLTSSVSLYSDRVPNTSNQMFGSGLYTGLGKELIRLDNLLTLTANHRKTKRNPEMQPCWGLPGNASVQNTMQCLSRDVLPSLETFPRVVLLVLPSPV